MKRVFTNKVSENKLPKQKGRILTYFLTAVMVISMIGANWKIDSQGKENLKVQTEVPDLREVLTQEFGEDFLVGSAICGNEIEDANIMALVTKHNNAITFGNELKPDCMFAYSNQICPGTQEVVLHGEKLIVPVLDFHRAEKMLDYFYNYNRQNPEKPIKIRGHVLTWHSQTPEWFFHEDYDTSKPYVSKEEMSKRHEWYIKTVLEHFVGEDSIYRELFYGWDVVNEAVSDGTGTYRNAEENSSWWAVYQSNEFIINAFRFANMYAPAELDLYYNDYNECNEMKCKGIVALLTDVKNAEGTRIDGMGMQGHYQNTENSPSVEQFMKAARAYASVVGQVQLTEMDFQANPAYDGTAKTYAEEDTRLAYRYRDFYDAIFRLRKEGIDFSGITIWGVIDRNSWLQSASFVGGGADGKRRQMPLLFDDDYQVKSAYWAFVDPSKLSYPIKTIQIMELLDASEEEEGFLRGTVYQLEKGAAKAEFIPMWKDQELCIKVSVTDTSKEETDKIAIYLEEKAGIEVYKVKRSEAKETSAGYETVVTIPVQEKLSLENPLRLDVVVVNGNEVAAFNDHGFNQANSTEFYAIGQLKPYRIIPKGSILVDGEMDEVWKTSPVTTFNIRQGAKASATARALWDEQALYVWVNVIDEELNATNSNAYEQDSVEIFIDEKNQKSKLYQSDDKQYRINYLNESSFQGDKCSEEYLTSAVKLTEQGYIVEAAICWTHLRPFHNKEIGIEIQVNDAGKDGTRMGTLNWSDAMGCAYQDTSLFGTGLLTDESTQIYEETEIAETQQVVSSNTKDSNIFVKIWNAICDFFKRLIKKLFGE